MWISLSTASGAMNASSPAPSAVIISWSCADSRVNESTRKAIRLPWRLSSQVACQKPSSSSVPPLAPVPGGNGTRRVRGRGRPERGQVPQHQGAAAGRGGPGPAQQRLALERCAVERAPSEHRDRHAGSLTAVGEEAGLRKVPGSSGGVPPGGPPRRSVPEWRRGSPFPVTINSRTWRYMSPLSDCS
jgi:hypothetical protein